MAKRAGRRERVVTTKGEFEETKKALQKRFGEASFHAAAKSHQPDRISTGVFMLDFALLGGIPHNRTSMIVGEKHAGKSMLADMLIANAQRQFPDQTAV